MNAKAAAIAQPATARPLVLLVDSHADSVEMYAIAFLGSGFDVATAATGADAIAQLARRLPSAIALEVSLRGSVSGHELCRHVRRQAEARAVPLVAVTALASQSDAARAAAAGCEVVLTKPCLPEALVDEVRRLLALTP